VSEVDLPDRSAAAAGSRSADTLAASADRCRPPAVHWCPACCTPAERFYRADTTTPSFAYPAAFNQLDDLALTHSPSAADNLQGANTDQATLSRRLDGASRAWLVEMDGNSVPTPLADSGLHPVAVYPAGDITITLYEH
jgi:hypothetical protein